MKENKVLSEEIELFKNFKRVSIAEFFERNRHLLGFDNPRRALLISVKEYVDNALDACEEYKILPDINIKIENINEDVYTVLVEDNGPGIPYNKVPEIYGSFLFGSKFHRFLATRGKQGIGASAVTLYSQLTTREPVEVITKIAGKEKAIKYKIKIDIKTNTPIVIDKSEVDIKKEHGTMIKATLIGQYNKGRQSVDEYVKLTALVNPHANIKYRTPEGEEYSFKRITNYIPELKEAKPHPHGIEIGYFDRLCKETKKKTLIDFLSKSFSSISRETAEKIIRKANLDIEMDPKKLTDDEISRLYKVLQEAKLRAMPSKYITIIGRDLILKSMENMFKPEYMSAISRKPGLYRGIPFIVEVGVAYGGGLTEFQYYRFANRVPLLYKAGEDAITIALKDISWKHYGFNMDGSEFPKDPVSIVVHVASVWLPFTSESKEAIEPYDEIVKEINLAVKNALRELSIYVKKKKTLENIGDKYKDLYGYGIEISRSLNEILNVDEKKVEYLIKDRIKKELIKDIYEIIKSVREVGILLKENKEDQAMRLIEKMLIDTIKINLITEDELLEIIKNAIREVKEKKINIEA
ncbi:DNA topoisomerase VI subunit B [Nanobdella aerobiophila]|uniref:Type 2 DNA topoisomerase 6 subunit B n=1 Tax=Nanobdella aerobiophila TaxID=2586965 RepID=A0A915SCP5_9ARCH|nr:DNA topoisomerase VI subunit B [Nanobdella aerobiophila]BBL45568.1 DNA topoisomerase VI subunit B [Nanobdella aerobiophila]